LNHKPRRKQKLNRIERALNWKMDANEAGTKILPDSKLK